MGTQTQSFAGSNQWLVGNGEMAERIRSFDWSKSPLGLPETWTAALRTTVGLMVANRFPQLLWWGANYISLYNDAYIPVLGNKHPNALGLPVRECWSEIWQILKPLIDAPYNGGPATWIEDFELHLLRSGAPEEAHFTVAYSAVPDATTESGIGGVLATVHEISEKVVAERRVVVLRDLAVETAESPVEVTCAAAARVLGRHGKDVPFALLYLIEPDRGHARLAGSAGTEPAQGVTPDRVSLDPADRDQRWPLAEALGAQGLVEITELASRFDTLPAGPWAEPPHTAVVVPLRANKADEPFGFLIGGVSSRLKLDELYRNFYDLAASHIATAITVARAYDAERKRSEALAEIDRVKTAFFSNVSHEFRTPLTLMLGPLEDLKRQLGGASVQEGSIFEQIDLVHRNGLRLLKLVNTLLDFSRIEDGRARGSYEPVDISAFTAELASVFRSAIEKAGLRLVVDCPPLSAPAYIDRDMWEKIVLNLLSNAFKFTFKGEIAVKLHETGSAFELIVRDTGTGIPPDDLPKIFERFHRVAGARGRTHEGSGIGLALVQELVQLHGGTVEAESVAGEGTTLRVCIPLGAAHLPQAQLGATAAQTPTAIGTQPFIEEALRWLPGIGADENERVLGDAPPVGRNRTQPTRGRRVLLVDDNADMRDYVRRLLDPVYDVRVAADGEEALAEIERDPPDLVLSDVMMPRLDGLGLLARLRSNSRTSTLPIILLSARAGEESKIEGLQTGADDYLIKPFTARELLARVAANLESARTRRTAVEAAETSEARLSAVLQELPVGVGMMDKNGRTLISNAAFRKFVPEVIPSRDPERTRYWRAWAADGSSLEPAQWPAARALRGETVAPGTEMRFTSEDTGEIWFLVSTAPMRDADDTIIGAVAVLQDIGERKKAEETQRLLLDELNHRVKNTLANVQAIAHQMLRRTTDPAEFVSNFSGRIQSLSRVHSMLTETTWKGVDLHNLIRDQLLAGAVDETRITAWGPPVLLDSQLTLHVALMLHELGTNAIKYGAHSVPKGIVTIDWSVTGDTLHLRWQERGGPAVRAPAKRGFGRTLIERSAKGEGGDAQMLIEADGVVWNVTLPLRDQQPLNSPAPQYVKSMPPEALSSIGKDSAGLAGKRLMVVEDEALVTLDIVASLEAAGAEVVGTAGTARAALGIIETAQLDGALLDANLRGEPVDGIAAALAARNIPFLFVTGYGTGSLPKSFAKSPMVSKPFSQDELITAVASLLNSPRTVYRLRT